MQILWSPPDKNGVRYLVLRATVVLAASLLSASPHRDAFTFDGYKWAVTDYPEVNAGLAECQVEYKERLEVARSDLRGRG